MADKIKRVDYYYVQVPNQPGQAFQTLATLKEANVNLLAFTAFPTEGGNSQVVMVPEKPEAFVKAAEKAALKLSAKKEAFFVQGKDRPGALAEVFNKLATAKINVHASNAATAGSAYGFVIWVKAKDVDAAAKVLGA
ncbi:MAG: ACT domain-containing protein [Deltaproteobacteria bacterium]|nr:ACT domain-containing protein [Deltaproteobacteria bacterium]